MNKSRPEDEPPRQPQPASIKKKSKKPSSEAPRRRRGAPPGNANALKHGFYSPRFKPCEIKDLEAFPINNLQDEILMLRVFIRRVLDRSDELKDPADYISALRALSIATRSITSLLRVHQLLGGDTSNFTSILNQAIKGVNQDLRMGTQSGSPPPRIKGE